MDGIRRRIVSLAEASLRRGARPVRFALLRTSRDRAPLPDILQIEATNMCNARCVFCPRDRMQRKQGIMDMALFEKIVDEASALKIRCVRLHNYGESLIDKRIVEKVRYAKSRGIAEVGLISNGSLLTASLADAMVAAGLDAINVSVDAAGKETFERTRLGLSYDRVIENIEGLVRARTERGARRPKLVLSFVRQDGSEAERDFIDKWSRVADKVHITNLHNWAGTLEGRAPVRFPCYRPWLTFTVLWDGRACLCCADYDGAVVVGDLRVQTMQEVWNGETFRAVRRQHLANRGPAICEGCDLPKKDSPLWVGKLFRRPTLPGR